MEKYVITIGYYDENGDGDNDIYCTCNSLYDAQNTFSNDAATVMAEAAEKFTPRDRIGRTVYMAVQTEEAFENCCDTMFYVEMPAETITECESIWHSYSRNAENYGNIAISIRWTNGQETDVLWFDNKWSFIYAVTETWVNDMSDKDSNPPRIRVWEYTEESDPYPVYIDPTNGRKMTTF